MTQENNDPTVRVVTLSTPLVDQDGKEHTSLTLKEPGGAAYVKIGDPYHTLMIDGKNMGVEQNRERLLSYAAEVTGIHRPLLLTMSFKDIQKVTDAMFVFFG
ncbi:phage tail assembly protein [Paraburkholderia sp. UCT2]|uniref:phage tail assembly protein n=1 Tax=Paraburkholderia sp. UCT2 TaxID=2615208 RepID=UPI0016567D5F|nr:phage tail assembly protein [Paraburkholderia sp. UCT2]MBC8729984.1 phage tail assembly protein [Paraburkholderia sp. UCT2]